MSSARSLNFRFELALLLLASAYLIRAQEIQFVNVPETVTEGTDGIAISWTGGTPGTPWTVQLVQDGRVVDGNVNDDDDDDIAGQTFSWDVDLEDSLGGYYTLRLIQGTQTADSAPINIIDESGRGATGPPPGATPTASAAESAPPSASAAPTDAIGSESASIAATATTLVTTVISGITITVAPDQAAPTGNSTGDALTESRSSGGGLSGGTIAGIVIGVLVAVALIAIAAFFLIRRRRRNTYTSPNEKNSTDPTYSTPATFAGTARSGGPNNAADSLKGGIKPELPADDKPLRTQPGMHELSSPHASTAGSRPHEMYSPDGSQTGFGATGLSHTRSDASGTVYSGGNRSSVSEVMGSPVEGSGSQGSVSPPVGHAIPRKVVGGSQGQGQGQPPTIHEMG